MKKHPHDAEAGQVEQLLFDIARVHHWTGLYAPGHPILAGRIEALRAALSGEARRERSGRIARVSTGRRPSGFYARDGGRSSSPSSSTVFSG